MLLWYSSVLLVRRYFFFCFLFSTFSNEQNKKKSYKEYISRFMFFAWDVYGFISCIFFLGISVVTAIQYAFALRHSCKVNLYVIRWWLQSELTLSIVNYVVSYRIVSYWIFFFGEIFLLLFLSFFFFRINNAGELGIWQKICLQAKSDSMLSAKCQMQSIHEEKKRIEQKKWTKWIWFVGKHGST